MSPDAVKAFLLNSLAFNYAILIIWFGVFSLSNALYGFTLGWPV